MKLLLWAILGILCFMAGPVGWLFFWIVGTIAFGWKLARWAGGAPDRIGAALGDVLRGRRRS
jgi:hypothetical protein